MSFIQTYMFKCQFTPFSIVLYIENIYVFVSKYSTLSIFAPLFFPSTFSTQWQYKIHLRVAYIMNLATRLTLIDVNVSWLSITIALIHILYSLKFHLCFEKSIIILWEILCLKIMNNASAKQKLSECNKFPRHSTENSPR